MYASVADFRAEGVDASVASDERLVALEEEARASIDAATGWWFEPRRATFVLDGRGSREIELPVPVVTLERLRVEGADVPISETLHVARPFAPVGVPTLVRTSGVFPRGRFNVEVTGTFGFLEGGKTPLLIRLATLLLVLRRLLPLGLGGGLMEREREARIVEEKTRDQTVRYAPPERSGARTTRPLDEVDTILLRYRRPPGLGAA